MGQLQTHARPMASSGLHALATAGLHWHWQQCVAGSIGLVAAGCGRCAGRPLGCATCANYCRPSRPGCPSPTSTLHPQDGWAYPHALRSLPAHLPPNCLSPRATRKPSDAPRLPPALQAWSWRTWTWMCSGSMRGSGLCCWARLPFLWSRSRTPASRAPCPSACGACAWSCGRTGNQRCAAPAGQQRHHAHAHTCTHTWTPAARTVHALICTHAARTVRTRTPL